MKTQKKNGKKWYSEVYLTSPHWIQVREQALQRAGRKCQQCHETFGLHVHHLSYDRLWAELPEDLEVLCNNCHSGEHGKTWNGRRKLVSSKSEQLLLVSQLLAKTNVIGHYARGLMVAMLSNKIRKVIPDTEQARNALLELKTAGFLSVTEESGQEVYLWDDIGMPKSSPLAS